MPPPANAIAADPTEASSLTARSNLVAVVTNGTAVLGLGSIGPLAAKPVMEGKAVLFKKFSGIDVFDIEIDETDPDRFCDIVASLEPTFGGINLEDIQGAGVLRDRVAPARAHEHPGAPRRPARHRDHRRGGGAQRGWNSSASASRRSGSSRRAPAAAALACLDLLLGMGLARENVVVTDIAGVVYTGREALMDRWKARWAVDTDARTLADVIGGADIFLGLSAPRVLEADHVARMAESPIILALANPVPEILPDVARKARRDAVIATGRSDYPNQVNNVLCFPFIFRGALDAGATDINEPMKLACVDALAGLARRETSDLVTAAYGGRPARFGPAMLIPRPFDPRLLTEIAPAVARAAMSSGVATRPIDDFDAYRERLTGFVFRSGLVMKPLFERARSAPKRVIYGEGEERRVLQAVHQVVAQGLARPILVGRPRVILSRIESLGLDLVPERDFDLVNILDDARFRTYWSEYHRVMGPQRRLAGRGQVRRALAGHGGGGARGAARRRRRDAVRHRRHLPRPTCATCAVSSAPAKECAISPRCPPTSCRAARSSSATPTSRRSRVAEEIVEMTMLACTEVRAFGMEPKVALLSRSNFGTHDSPTAERMRCATRMLHEAAPDLEVDGEMHADAALSESIRARLLPDSRLEGQANLLVMPNVEAANIAHNLLRGLGGGVSIGPILVGAARSAHVVTQTITVRGLVNMTALAVAQVGALGGARA